MKISEFEKLFQEGLITPASLHRVREAQSRQLFSVHWELKTILYLGVLLLSSGLSVLIYKNIDTIGHQAVLALIAGLCIGCFYYAGKHHRSFSWQKAEGTGPFTDYAVLLGCLLAVTFIAYLQAQYCVFGMRYGLATFFPMLLLFFCAYYFDHIGVLSLAITNFAAWLGLTITPYRIFTANDFDSKRVIYTGLLIGIILMGAAFLSRLKNKKAHFAFTYQNFGMHIFYIATLVALFSMGNAWFLLLAAFSVFIYFEARREKSFYFMLMMVLYMYVGVSYLAMELLLRMEEITIVLFYFILSALGVAGLLVYLNKTLRQ